MSGLALAVVLGAAALMILVLIVIVVALFLALQDANDEIEWLWSVIAEKDEELDNTVERRFKRYAENIRERFDQFMSEVDETHEAEAPA